MTNYQLSDEISYIHDDSVFYNINSSIQLDDSKGDIGDVLFHSRSSGKNRDLVIYVEINDGKAKIEYSFSDNYLLEFLPILDVKMQNRGFKSKAKGIRIKSLKELKFLKFPELDLEQVPIAIKQLYISQLLTKYIFKNLMLPKSFWRSSDDEYEKWKKHLVISPIIAGVIDGMIDEIKYIPDAIFSLLKLHNDISYEDEIINSIDSDLLDNLILENLENGLNKELSEYNAARTIVSAGSLLNN
jgi:hypothetical protein